MNRANVLSIVLFNLIFVFCSCNKDAAVGLNDYSIEVKSEALQSEDIYYKETIIDEGKNYKITLSENNYYYVIYDSNENIKKSGGPFHGAAPNINMVNDDLLKFTCQSGTGAATRWGFYYNVKDDVISDDFTSIYDEHDGKVICRESFDNIIVRDIFDKNAFYKEFVSFK